MTNKQRLDHYLSKQYPDISRGFLQKLIADAQVMVNGKSEKSGFKVNDTDKIDVLYDMASIGVVPDIDLPILFEDDDVLVVDKPAGVLSHALTKFHNEPSVASFLRQHMKSQKNDDPRFGIVHRLDRATSGVMICAKNHETLSDLQKQFGNRTVNKTYLAVVTGVPKTPEAIIDIPLERNPKAPATWRPGSTGKPAQTSYKVLRSANKHSLVELKPKTGRTHQIRVHLNHLGHPIVGDVLYEGEDYNRLCLHAAKLEIKLRGQSETFKSPPPKEFDDLLKESL